jgi:hypothetical protein
MPSNHSIVIDAALTCDDMDFIMLTVDEYGTARPQGSACDIGAIEANCIFVNPFSDPSTAPDSRRVGDNACMSAILVPAAVPTRPWASASAQPWSRNASPPASTAFRASHRPTAGRAKVEREREIPAADQDFSERFDALRERIVALHRMNSRSDRGRYSLGHAVPAWIATETGE